MTLRFPFLPIVARIALCALVLAVPAAQAEKADRAKPMNIEADAMRYDDLKQISLFSGNVVASKGTILIRGARIEVRQDPEGYQYGTVTAAAGKRAYFKQKRDAPGDEWIEGESEVIEYDSRADTVRFVRRAVMRRLNGPLVSDETSGALIVYDQGRDTYSVDGAVPASGGAPAAGGRVRAIITPRQTAPAPSAAPAAPGGAPLRSSPRLGGDTGK